MSSGTRRVQAVGFAWYRRETYAATRALMADATTLAPDYEKFLYGALKMEEKIKRSGAAVIRVHLDTDEFPAFCRERNLDLDSKGRRAYANFIAAQMIQAKESGNA